MSNALTQEQADDLFDTLQAEIEAAAAEEAELEIVLTRLEALILEDILAGTYSPEETNGTRSRSQSPSTAAVTPSTSSEFGLATSPDDPGQETFIQQKSLALLPLLCRFPLFTPSASERIIKLIVLVSKRLNPKELWFGLDSVVETSRVGLEGMADLVNYDKEDHDTGAEEASESADYSLGSDEPPEYISIYLSRALIAMQIVIPRINVKKPEKYLKPVLDALTGCFTAIETPELRDQILDFQEFEFSGTLLLVNTTRVIVIAWTWAQSRQPNPDNTFQLALRRLYLLAIRSLLPLCKEAPMIFSRSSGETELRLASLRRSLLEPSLPLDIHSLEDLEHIFTAPEQTGHASELHKHKQRTMSHIIIAAIMVRYMEDEAAQSRYILQFLPSALKLILEEDIDALLRTVLLYASFSLGEAAVQGRTRSWGERQVGNGSAGISTFEGIGAVLQVLIDQFDVIERFPSLQNAPAPPRKVLTLCQHLISDLRLATSERDELITRLLKAENTHIRTAGLTALRTLVVAEEMGMPSVFLDTLLPKFGTHLFGRQMRAEDLVSPQAQDWLMCLLNFIYVFDARRCPLAAINEDSTKVRFLTDVGTMLKAASMQTEPVAELLASKAVEEEEEEQSPDVNTRLQLEILKDAFERVSHPKIGSIL